MVEQKQKVDITWLQCQLPRDEWNSLNERRAKLNLKWADIIVPATKEYLTKLETPAKRAPAKPKSKKATKNASGEEKPESSTASAAIQEPAE